MSVESVRLHLKKYNLEDKLMKEPTTCKTVIEAAQTLGCHESDIAKTMSFDVDSKTVIIVMAGDKKVDNAKYKAYFQKSFPLNHSAYIAVLLAQLLLVNY